MSNLSDVIEGFIKDLINDADSSMIEIQRNLLAQQFGCAPSQINYVLTTRFNNDKGYIVESRRGGGGYVKIFRVQTPHDDNLEDILNKSIGTSITINKAFDIIDVFKEKGIISTREQNIMKRALSERAFNKVYHEDRNKLRADVLKEMLLSVLNEKN